MRGTAMRNGFRSVAWALSSLLVCALALGQEPVELLSTPLAESFGSAPLARSARLSPDGNRISFVRARRDGSTIALVLDTRSGSVTGILAGDRDAYDISWCAWANEQRLLCSLRGVERLCGPDVPARPCRDNARAALLGNRLWSRLVAVDADGSGLIQPLRGLRTQYQDRIVDWLPDDPEHVLIALGSRLVRLNIYDSDVEPISSRRNPARDWITDGHGNVKLRFTVSDTALTWYVLEQGRFWTRLHRTRLTDLGDQYSAIAYDADANEVIFYDRYEGRLALFALELDNDRERRLLYTHPRFDVGRIYQIGRYERLVGVEVIENRPRPHFFDPQIARVHDILENEFPGMTIRIIDEDWAQRRYLVSVSSDRDPGAYYVLDTESSELTTFSEKLPELSERDLAVMQPISYPADDGTEIPAYLTLPSVGASGAGIVLPHDDPSSRDYRRFDFLAQFLAARGYAVLQSNYRGSGGYGEVWSGDGGYQDWPQAVDDIVDGARYLVEAGIVEPGRLCVVGRGYGGYVALLNAIEHFLHYRCVVSIAGVTDPRLVARRYTYVVGGLRNQAFVGSGGEVYRQGSPLDRADEIRRPTLLFHSRDDVDTPLRHSVELRDAMLDSYADVELVEYEHAGHGISPPKYRIDMLTRLDTFLDAHLNTTIPDFFSTARSTTDAIEIIDFGVDAAEPNGICSDLRFMAADGGVLRDIDDPFPLARDDATDCRRLFLSGEIVLREEFAPGSMPEHLRATFFVDTEQQAEVEIVSFNGSSNGQRSGVPVVHGWPGYGIVGVRAPGRDYACTVSVENPRDPQEPVYVVQPRGSDEHSSYVVVPAYASRYYRIRAQVVNDVLLLRVVDAIEDRVLVDQRDRVEASCGSLPAD